MDPTDFENSTYGKVQLLFSLSAILIPITFSFTSFNPIIVVMHDLFNETHIERYHEAISIDVRDLLISFAVAFPILISLVGALTTKYIMNRMGLKKVQIVAHIYNVFCNVIMIALIGGLTGSYEAIIVGRMLLGMYYAMGFSIAPALVGEMCAKKNKHFYNSLVGVFLACGGFLGPIMAYNKVLGTIYLWPVLVSLTALLSVIWLLVCPFIVDSPYNLLAVGEKKRAIEALRKLRRGDKNAIDDEILAMEGELSNFPSETRSEGTSEQGVSVTKGICEICRTQQYRRILFAVCFTFANMMLVGANALIFYSDQIFISANLVSEAVTPATIGIFTGQFIVAIFGSQLLNRYGAKKVNIAGITVIIIGQILITLSLSTSHLSYPMRYISVAGMIIFMVGWSGGPNLATFSIAGGITTHATRSTCITYGTMCYWSTAFFVAFLSPYLQKGLGPYFMVPWFVWTIIALIVTIFYIPEMRGKSEEEIQQFFKR